MLEFKTLTNIPIKTITDAFNQAFSDYLIPLQLNEEQMVNKLKSEDYRPEFSVGAFYQDKLVGFILHGYREDKGTKKLYNGGTGVIPAQRRQHLTLGMYDFILPRIKELGIDQVILEVIENNIPAYKSYSKIGFSTSRRFRCFVGQPIISAEESNISIQSLDVLPWNEIESFWSIRPSWQNALQSIQNIADKLIFYAAYHHHEMIGYIVYNPISARIHQLAVAPFHRHQGVGQAMLQCIVHHHSKDIGIINVDENHSETVKFLEQTGLQNSINLYEMILEMN